MDKIIINIDANKLTTKRVQERPFTKRDGSVDTARELKLELVPLKEPKIVKSGDTWNLVKRYFVTYTKTREEKDSNTNPPIIGEGLVFEPSQLPMFNRQEEGEAMAAFNRVREDEQINRPLDL